MSIQKIRKMVSQPQKDNLPYKDPFKLSQQVVIEKAIAESLQALKAEGRLSAPSLGEVEITNYLIKILNILLLEGKAVPGFSSATFLPVSSAEELESHNSINLQKKPDLIFRSTVRPSGNMLYPAYWAFFVECKIVDPNHTMSRYCSDGLSRFVLGDYAWAVSTAMMLGYARNNYVLPTQLWTHLDKPDKHGTIGVDRYNTTEKERRKQPRRKLEIYTTKHDRNLPRLQQAPDKSITIHHLWLKID